MRIVHCFLPVRISLLGLMVSVSGGCLLHDVEKDPRPVVDSSATFLHASGEAHADLTSPWWAAFGDSELDALVTSALESNLELAALSARVEQASAIYRQSGSELFPQVGYGAGYSAAWDDLDGNADRSESSRIRGFLDWELDVWGRLRSLRESDKSRLFATQLDLESARIILSAAVVENWFSIHEARQQLSLVGSQITVNETLLDLTRLRFGQGQSSIVDVLQQQQQLASTRSLLPDIEFRIEQLELALDVLTGSAAGTRARFTGRPIAAPPAHSAAGLPSDLLINRPDLLAAQQEVIAVDHEIGAAVADRLPRLNIGGSVSYVGDPSLGTLIADAFADLTGPLFDAGRRRAEVDRQRARLEEALANYSQAFIEAVRDVETALLAEQKQAEKVELLESEWSTARRLLTETRNRYSQGLTDYLPVLAAVSTEQNLQRELLTSRRELLSAHVSLHRALGGSTGADTVQTAKHHP